MDIVKTLRNQEWVNWHTTAIVKDEKVLMSLQNIANKAADEIERLREKLSKTTYTDNFPVTEEDL